MTEAGEEARVVDVALETAHDSESLLVVTLAFPNGARSQLQLDGPAAARIVRELGLPSVGDLVGRPFSELAPALPANARQR